MSVEGHRPVGVDGNTACVFVHLEADINKVVIPASHAFLTTPSKPANITPTFPRGNFVF